MSRFEDYMEALRMAPKGAPKNFAKGDPRFKNSDDEKKKKKKEVDPKEERAQAVRAKPDSFSLSIPVPDDKLDKETDKASKLKTELAQSTRKGKMIGSSRAKLRDEKEILDDLKKELKPGEFLKYKSEYLKNKGKGI